MNRARAEFFEDAQPLHGARHEERAPNVVCEVELRAVQDRVEELLCVDDAAKVIEVLVRDGEYVVLCRADDAQLLGACLGEVDPRDLRARGHEGGGGLVAHVKDAVDHVLLRLFKRAVLRALLHEILDGILRDGGAVLGIDANEKQQSARNGDERGARQRRQAREQTDCLVAAHENPLGILQGDLLWQEVTEEQGECCHDENAEDERGGKDLHAGQEPRKKSAKGGRCQQSDAKPHEEAGAGDARLCHGKRRRGVLKDGECRRCVPVAVIGEALKPAAVRGGECSLNLCKVGVCQEADNEQDECKQVG